MNTPGLTWAGAACSVRACVYLNHGLYNLTGGPFRTPTKHISRITAILPFPCRFVRPAHKQPVSVRALSLVCMKQSLR